MVVFKSVSPKQTRLIDPYEKIITSNAINRQFSTIFANKGFVNGFQVVQKSGTRLDIQPGIVVIDKTVIEFPTAFSIDLSKTGFKANSENVLYIHYRYSLTTPPNEAQIDIVGINDFLANYTGNEDTYLIVKFLHVSDLSVIDDIYDKSKESDLERDKDYIAWFLYKQSSLIVDKDLDLHGHRIINVPDPENDLDLVNKKYTDKLLTDCKQVITDTVLVDKDSNGFSHFTDAPCKQGGYLDEVIIAGDNVQKEIITQDDGYKVIQLTKLDKKIRVVAGDSIYNGGL